MKQKLVLKIILSKVLFAEGHMHTTTLYIDKIIESGRA